MSSMAMARIEIRSSSPASETFWTASFIAGSHGSMPTTDASGQTRQQEIDSAATPEPISRMRAPSRASASVRPSRVGAALAMSGGTAPEL
jgi:hypothetical protein